MLSWLLCKEPLNVRLNTSFYVPFGHPGKVTLGGTEVKLAAFVAPRVRAKFDISIWEGFVDQLRNALYRRHVRPCNIIRVLRCLCRVEGRSRCGNYVINIYEGPEFARSPVKIGRPVRHRVFNHRADRAIGGAARPVH